MPRMNILNTVEREAFNSPPDFSSFQRKQYFDFPSKVKERVVDLSLVRGLYDQLSPTLQSLALMPGGIRYYAESVLRSEIF